MLDDCHLNISKTSESVRQLKDYFQITKSRLLDIQKDFTKRMEEVKKSIKEFKENIVKGETYEVQLKLEYQIRLEINRLYTLKHSHESEMVGLDKRLEELEAFNTSTELIHSLLNYQLINFFEKVEDKMLVQQRDAAVVRLASILNAEIDQWKVAQGEDTFKQIEKLYNLTIESPITDERFKDFLHSNILAGKGDSTRKLLSRNRGLHFSRNQYHRKFYQKFKNSNYRGKRQIQRL